MNSKIIFIALAMSFGAGLAAHADEYQRPRRPVPQQDDQYDEPEEDLDEDYRRPSRDCYDPCRPQQRRPEYYCQQPHCAQPRHPHVMPYPYQYQQPILRPVPLPIRIVGPCTVMPTQFGWTIYVNGNYPLAHGSRQEAPNLLFLRQHYIQTGVCTVFLN